ncbi:type II restriction endonuclease [Oenococcus oeni]|uniref:type IIG restriction enzyme/methyltransferase n=2 Tax=Oenococcus oeni TaxID=1247 RepID=UPI0008F9691D|nr:TaqI-like C-terminal specificity domain-containing protein [Oenococcus oeni]OIM23274.1 type II restriction endonuclease [Oenococcus oeni]
MPKKELLDLNQAINKNVKAIVPLGEDKVFFEKHLNNFIQDLDCYQNESEEFQKNLFRDFLRQVIPNKQINTSERIDLAIYNGRDQASSVGVIVEYKKLSNVSEMMSPTNLNAKAFRELVAYYLNERIGKQNIEVKRGIVTNGFVYFVISSKELEKYFINNENLVRNFQKYQHNQLSASTTDFLYDKVIAPEIDKALNKGIDIACFDIRDYLVKDRNELNKKTVTQLYRFFSEENLLNGEILSDSNKLNKSFYDELLYIMGLHESKEGKSKVIDRLPESERQSASLIENTMEQLDIQNVLPDKQFDIAIQLVVVWVNRILFLKLLESSLVTFNEHKDFRFLNAGKITSFNDLNDLFFAIMAKRPDERLVRLKDRFSFVPYMNSSLFEMTKLEKSTEGIRISDLREATIDVFSKTKLRGTDGKKLTGKISILDYLFKFLDSYDFVSSINTREENPDQLINASVLGLIFEKINGYKDGSFFTPGKITMFMAQKAIHQAALDKINRIMDWKFQSFSDLSNQMRDYQAVSIADRKKISDSLDTLKILDPAVGSGHFLVSALNELIAIKSSLRVLFDANGDLVNSIQCSVVNDELIVQDAFGENFVYGVGKTASLKIQKTLFEQKRIIIENCLFGVDINPNSVNICRLRLWIELLKSAYYDVTMDKNNPVLTTLPNIDINIKVGDSLIHKFGLQANFDLRNSDFKNYLDLVDHYKNTSDKKIKAELNDKINEIKTKFYKGFRTPEGEAYDRAEAKVTRAGSVDLFKSFGKSEKAELARLQDKANQAHIKYQDALKVPMYQKGMEWRIEFPEVLNTNGDFVGFDVVIANPPYIFARNESFDQETKKYYVENYQVDEYQANTYTLFMELGYRLLKKEGIFAYIVPNNMLTIQSNQKIRDFVYQKTGDLTIINSLDKIFTDASVDNCLVFFKKEEPNKITVGELEHGEYQLVGTVDHNFFGKVPIFSISMVKYKDAINAYWKVNQIDSIKQQKVADVKTGIKAYQAGKGKPRLSSDDVKQRIYHSNFKQDDTYLPYIDGLNVNRYKLSWNQEYIKYGDNLAEPRRSTNFKEPRILVRQIPTKSTYSINAAYVDKIIINDLNSMVVEDIKINSLALLGLINSKPITLWFLMRFDKFQRRIFPQFKVNELEQFPVPDMSKELQDQIAQIVKKIMDKSSQNKKFDSENAQVDELIMEAMNLTDAEKESIRNFQY